jgi:AcrR family transcriptional regulator
MIAVIDRVGWKGVRVRSLAATAGVSTSTFYRHFVDADDCLASTYDEVMLSVIHGAAERQRDASNWRDALCVAVASCLGSLSQDPQAARLALVEIFGAGPNARQRIRGGVGGLEQMLAESFVLAPREVKPPRHLVAGMAAGMLRVARTTSIAGRGGELSAAAGELSEWMMALPDPAVLSLLPLGNGTLEGGARKPGALAASTETTLNRGVGDDRERLIRAVIRLSTAEGVANLTAVRLRAEAGVSRQRFEACFESLDDCLSEAVEIRILGEAARIANRLASTESAWERRVCRYVRGLCIHAAKDQAKAKLALLGVFATGRTGLLRREETLRRTAVNLCATVPVALRPTAMTAEASVAAAWHIAQSDVAAGRTQTLPSVAPLLSYVLLAPIVGPRTAFAAIETELCH